MMSFSEFIRADMNALREIAARDHDEPMREIHDQMADNRLVDHATRAMTEKLAQARSRGRGGWWDPTVCSIESLRQKLRDHVEKGDMRDVMNIAAMIYVREIVDGV